MTPPYFWQGGLDPRSRASAPLTRWLLTPLAALYAAGAARRQRRARPARIAAQVICVGNLTLGGVGKTPITAAIRDRLVARGLRAASLSRGYGGRLRGPLRVRADHHRAGDVGDEPLLLAQSGEAWIGRDRVLAARDMSLSGVQVVVMDDGHQNPTLAKDLSLVVLDTSDPVGNGHVFPKGPLREPLSAGLARADAIVLMGEGPAPSLLDGFDGPILRAELAPTAQAPGGPLVAFAGIGRPQKVFDSLLAAGADLAESVPFPDHHPYRPGDLAYLQRLAAARGARLITTEKDHVRLPPAIRPDVLTWPVKAVFQSPETLEALLDRLLSGSAT